MKVKLGKFGDLPFQTFSFEVYNKVILRMISTFNKFYLSSQTCCA